MSLVAWRSAILRGRCEIWTSSTSQLHLVAILGVLGGSAARGQRRSRSWAVQRSRSRDAAAASTSRILAEDVALAALGVDELGRVALVDLAAQMRDMDIEHVAHWVARAS